MNIIIEYVCSHLFGCLVHYYYLWCINSHRKNTRHFTEGKWLSQGLFTRDGGIHVKYTQTKSIGLRHFTIRLDSQGVDPHYRKSRSVA